jgi:hypothetical protein
VAYPQPKHNSRGFHWPAWQIEGEDALGTPVRSIGHQDHIRARQLRAFAAHHQPDFAEPSDADGQGKRPVGGLPHCHGAIRCLRKKRDEVLHGHRWPRQPNGLACCILQDKAVGLQVPVLFQPADPVFAPVACHRH